MIAAVPTAYADAERKLQLEALSALPMDRQAPLIGLQRRLVTEMTAVGASKPPDLPSDSLRAAVMTVFGIVNWFYTWHRPDKGLDLAGCAALAARFVKGGLAALGREALISVFVTYWIKQRGFLVWTWAPI